MADPKRRRSLLRGEEARDSLARWIAPTLIVVCFGCDGGTLNGGKASSGEPGGTDSDLLGDSPGGVELSCDEDADLAVTPLLKLSTTQYKNTVRDLIARFGLDSIAAEVEGSLGSVPNDSLGDGFRGLDERVALEHVQAYFNVGVAIGNAVKGDAELLAKVAPSCAGVTELTAACWDGFASGFLRTAYRRPLNVTEETAFNALKSEVTGVADTIRAAIIVALSSPRFVYHVEVDGSEVGTRSDLLELDAYEVAARLSYTFWQTMPDEELLAAAADGSLLSDTVYEQQLRRVWEDQRSQATLQQFWTEWLLLEKFTGFETSRPGFIALAAGERFDDPTSDYYGDMVQEIRDLTTLYTFTEPASLKSLLLSNRSVTNSEDLASLYGVAPWDGSSDYPTFPEGERSGLLQRAALLVSNLEQTNPFHRGALIRRAILCDSLPTPDPNDLPPGALDPPPFDPAQSTRERFTAKIEGNTLCEGCHTGFSPIGYVMESFDALGRFRTTERVFDEQSGELLAELPIDTTGDVRIASSTEAPVTDAAEMNDRIAQSGKVEACMAQSYFRYVARRASNKSSLDKCVIDDLAQVLEQEDGGLSAAFQRMARVSTFFTKKVGPQ